jgi:hypothetical protein
MPPQPQPQPKNSSPNVTVFLALLRGQLAKDITKYSDQSFMLEVKEKIIPLILKDRQLIFNIFIYP